MEALELRDLYNHPFTIDGTMLKANILEKFKEKVKDLTDEDKESDPEWKSTLLEEAVRESLDEQADFINDRMQDEIDEVEA